MINKVPSRIFLYNTVQYVELMKEKFDKKETCKVRIMSLALPLFQLKATLWSAVSTVMSAPWACIHLSAGLLRIFLDPNIIAFKLLSTLMLLTPSMTDVVKLAIKTAKHAANILCAPLMAIASPTLFFKYYSLERIKSKTPTASEKSNPTGFDDIVGMEKEKQIMQPMLATLSNPKTAKEFGLGLPSGVIFHGAPGCGKSFFAAKFIEELEKQTSKTVTCHRFSADKKSKYSHETSNIIAALFEQAAKDAAKNDSISVIMIEEIDTIIPAESTHDHLKEERGTFLTALEHAAKRNVFVMGTTNYLETIDKAVRRPGRFDFTIEITPPDQPMVQSLLTNFFKACPLENIDLAALAQRLEGCSTAQIKSFAEQACRIALVKTLESRKQNPQAPKSPITQEMLDGINIAKSPESKQPSMAALIAALRETPA
jgi:SpoVK/Ycf46/Vps4 family AAA+-type ATPase